MDQTRQDFIVEIEGLVEQIIADLEELRVQLTDGAARRRLLADLFRRTHSLKGSAAAINLEPANRIAHALEHRIAEVNAGRAVLNREVLGVMEEAVDLLVKSFSPRVSRELEAAIESSIESLREIGKAQPESVRANCEFTIANLPPNIRESLTESQRHHLSQAVSEQSELFIVSSVFDLADFDQQVYQLKARLEELGEVVSTHPNLDPTQPDRIEFRLLFLSKRGSLALASEFNLVEMTPVSTGARGEREVNEDVRDSQPASLSVRVELDKIQTLRRLANDVATITFDVLEPSTSKAAAELAGNSSEKAIDRIRAGFREIDRTIASFLLVRADGILKRAERAGRAAARLTGKEILFETAGAELLLDKYLSEALASPLVHLVRNAVDHGIENASDRGRLGKSPSGTIRIEASRETDQLVIRVSDDGRGIDPELVSVAAAKAGLIEAGVELDLEESLSLLFKSGFSTAGSVSTTSGRGIGLDVVETAVQKIGGKIRVVSEPGFGSTFEPGSCALWN